MPYYRALVPVGHYGAGSKEAHAYYLRANNAIELLDVISMLPSVKHNKPIPISTRVVEEDEYILNNLVNARCLQYNKEYVYFPLKRTAKALVPLIEKEHRANNKEYGQLYYVLKDFTCRYFDMLNNGVKSDVESEYLKWAKKTYKVYEENKLNSEYSCVCK